MAERIYTVVDGELEALDEKAFAREDELQVLIAEHPELIDGEQIRPGDARRWILVTREKGIAESSGTPAKWALDHLLIDQDAVPTLAELKRGTNSEIRRTIVGQLLEYAAHAADTWTASELRAAFKHGVETRGRDAREELAALLRTSEEPDIEQFWEKVSTNLAARRLRLLFVADDIPDPLARTVAFLNAQMPDIEVLAVEIKRFPGKSGQMLVPRVIGRTSARRGSSSKVTRESFLGGFADDDVRGVAERLLEVAQQTNGEISYGSQGVSVRARCPAWRQPISVAWLYSQPGQGWMRTREFSFGSAVVEEDLPDALRTKLERWVAEFAADSFTEDVSSKGVEAWVIRHEGAVEHTDLLVRRLRTILSDLASL
ncbi:MAG: hypothetical protein OXF33_09015 [Rhodospirillales bacterium]|nr:hypothetical protein [Rhodospirillales bacterium]